MIFENMKAIQKNLKKYNYKRFDEKTLELLNNTLYNFLKNSIRKLEKKYNKLEKVEEKHVKALFGGDPVMPSEWYGVNSERYSDDVDYQSTNATNSLIRQRLNVDDPSGIIQEGGKNRYKVSTNGFTTAFEEAQNNLKANSFKISLKARKALKEKYEKLIHEALQKYKKKSESGDEFHSSHFKQVLAIKKFSLLT
jgi:hypothetical protein